MGFKLELAEFQLSSPSIDVKNIDLQIKNIKTCFFQFYKKHA